MIETPTQFIAFILILSGITLLLWNYLGVLNKLDYEKAKNRELQLKLDFCNNTNEILFHKLVKASEELSIQDK